MWSGGYRNNAKNKTGYFFFFWREFLDWQTKRLFAFSVSVFPAAIEKFSHSMSVDELVLTVV